MKYSFSEQADRVKEIRDSCENVPLGVFVGFNFVDPLREAETTLRALALIGETSILSAAKLADIAREIIAIVDEKGCLYDEESIAFANRFKRILNK